MEPQEHYREVALTAILEDMPKKWWEALEDRSRFAYGDSFSAVKSDKSLLDDQRQQKLYHERYFKMEYELISVSKENGVPASATLIGENLCHYAYAGRGRVSATQSYVPISGDMPKPAAFRKQLAHMADFQRVLRLPFDDEPFELVTPKSVFGILLHSPVGRRFTEDEQKLGALGYFIPYKDFSGWAASFAVAEIIAAYPVETREDRAAPIRKKAGKTGTEGE